MLNKEQLNEFNEIYFKEYGIRLGPEDLVNKATGLLNLFKLFVLLKNNKLLDNVVAT